MDVVRVSIAIINMHGIQDTLECLQSLAGVQQSGMKLDTIVVNVRSEKKKVDFPDITNEGEQIKKKFPSVHVIETENNGFSGNNNTAFLYIRDHIPFDYVLLLNNDTVIHPSFLTELVRFATEKHDTGIFSPKIYFDSGCEFHKDAYTNSEKGKVIWYAGGCVDKRNMLAWHKNVDEVDEGQSNISCPTDFCTGCCLLIPKKVFETVGQFDEQYFLYWEDTDYSYRVRKNGGMCWHVPSAIVWHKNAGSTGGSGSELQQYYQTRNRLLFGMKYAPLRTKIALWREAFGIFLSGSMAEKEAIQDAFFGRFGKRRSK